MSERLVVVDGVRTPFCKMGTSLASVPADELGRVAVNALLARTGFDPGLVDEVIFGCVAQPADAANVSRVIALRAGIPQSVPAVTVHRNCASGLESFTQAYEKLVAGQGSVFIVGGAESMSQVPLLFKPSAAKKFSHLMRAKSIFQKLGAMAAFRPGDFAPRVGLNLGLTDPVSGLNMGQTAEVLAREFAIGREAQDAFALESHKRAIAAREKLAGEICPVYERGKAITQDNGPRENQSMEALAALRPVFDKKFGTVTAGNSSQITDGATALLVMSEKKASELGCTPLGWLTAYAYAGCDPKRMGLGPAYATAKVQRASGLLLEQADIVEINEAFAAQVIAAETLMKSDDFAKSMGLERAIGTIPPEKLNVNGGAIALGHPVGATGARMVLSGLKELQRRNGKRILLTLCVGGGQGAARLAGEAMNIQNIQRKDTDDHICVLTFDRAGSSANIFDKETLLELDGLIGEISNDKPKGLVIISAKNNIFIAGADLKSLATLRDAELKEYIQLGQTVLNHLADLKIPTVAAIHGACVGGGFELSLACDHRIATDERATKIGLPEVNLGILPAWGGSTRLPRLIGLPGALDLILGGKTLAAKPALKRGIIDLIVPREYLLQTALKLAHQHKSHHFLSRILHSPPVNKAVSLAISKFVEVKVAERAKGHYPAILKAKDVIMRGAAEWSREKSLALEADAVTELAKTEASRNLLNLVLQQEIAKKFNLPGVPVTPPRKISKGAVIGAGVMGASIAQWLSARGMRVVLKDVDAARVAAGMDRVKQLYAAGYKRHTFTFVEARDGFDRITPMPSDFPMKDIEIIIEAAVEKMDLKKRIFAQLDAQAPQEAVLATNTSALSITEIASATKNPGRVIGIHFFNPVHKMQLVEVVAGKQTSPEIVQSTVKFVQQIGKLPVVVRDSPGFLVNRILLPYLVEAASLFENGAETEAIDDAMIEFGMPMGPLRLIDEVGVDVSADVAATLAEKFRGRSGTPELLAKMIQAGLLGRKSGAGFYIHKGGEPRVNPGVGKFRTGASAIAYNLGELQRRMALLMVNEAARCLEEQVVATPADVDFGMVMGTGFAPFRGGPLAYVDSTGIAKIVDDMKTLVQAGGTQYEPCALLGSMAAAGKKFYGN